jgi:osmotically-inducible protein OsmY
MSSKKSELQQSFTSSEELDDVLKDAGMRHFKNEARQSMRTRAANVLIEQFQDAETQAGMPAAAENVDIVSAVENALASSGELDSSYIFVSAEGSDITLAGWVSSKAEVRRSAAIAARVRGVHAVHNEISRAL